MTLPIFQPISQATGELVFSGAPKRTPLMEALFEGAGFKFLDAEASDRSLPFVLDNHHHNWTNLSHHVESVRHTLGIPESVRFDNPEAMLNALGHHYAVDNDAVERFIDKNLTSLGNHNLYHHIIDLLILMRQDSNLEQIRIMTAFNFPRPGHHVASARASVELISRQISYFASTNSLMNNTVIPLDRHLANGNNSEAASVLSNRIASMLLIIPGDKGLADMVRSVGEALIKDSDELRISIDNNQSRTKLHEPQLS